MEKPIIAIASDHAGVDLKTSLKEFLKNYSDNVIDLGTNDKAPADYSDYGNAVAKTVLSGKAQFGIAICGAGIGISIAANRHRGIRAALCSDGLSASFARRHNDANVLCLGARLIGIETANDCVKQFLTTAFESTTKRYSDRIKKLDE